jgi:hypothetical protein
MRLNWYTRHKITEGAVSLSWQYRVAGPRGMVIEMRLVLSGGP